MTEVLFAAFALMALMAACGVVLSRNPIYSVLSLILTFVFLAGIYVLWGAEFIAVVQVLIYTGAIVVLFLFVVMLLSLRREPVNRWRVGPTLVCTAAAVLFTSFILKAFDSASMGTEAKTQSLKQISRLLFTEYLWPFEVLSLFLVVVIVAVYALARPETRG